jgi:hypothetical protein
MFLMESVDSMGGLISETVLTDLGEFEKGGELNPDFSEILQIKTAKARQREQQSKENERLAMRFVKSYNGLADRSQNPQTNAAAAKIKNELQETKRFVRLGKPDYYQSQMEIIAKYSASAPELSEICAEYKSKLDRKNAKWAAAKLKSGKTVTNAAERVGLDAPETIGGLDPKRRADFDEYYEVKSPKIAPYLLSDEEYIEAGTAADPFVAVDAQTHKEAVQYETEQTEQDAAHESPQDAAQKASQDAAQKAAQEAAQESVQIAQESAQKASQDAAQKASQESPQDAAQKASHDAAQDAAQESTHDAAQKAAQETVQITETPEIDNTDSAIDEIVLADSKEVREEKRKEKEHRQKEQIQKEQIRTEQQQIAVMAETRSGHERNETL